ncbi:MAG: histidine kinase dimerization/phospho-acceptor domain-containing protein, partial [Lysinibacillus sp.]
MKKQTFLILFLLIFAFAGVITFLDRASTYIGKSAVDEGVVQQLQDSYIDYLYQTEVIKQSKDELLKSSPVTEAEIEAYRTYYGSMQEQIDNIKEQYEGATKEELKVRDKKINDIRTNFKNDNVVRDKVAKLKAEAIEDYLKDVTSNVETFDKAQHFNFLIEIEGQPLQDKIGDSKSISERSRSYNAETISQELNVLHRSDEEIDLPFEIELNYPKAFIQVELLQSIYKDSNFGDEIENFEWRKIAFYFVWLLTAIAIVYLVIERKMVKEMFEEFEHVKLPKITKYIDVNVGIVFFGVWMSVILADDMSHFVETIVYSVYYSNSLVDIISRLISIFILVVFTVGTLLVGTKLVNQLRQSKFTKEQFILSKVIHYMKEVFYNRSLGTQMLGALIVFACAGFGFSVVMMMPPAILVYIPLFIAIVIPTLIMFLRRFAYLSRIMTHTMKLAQGHITEPLEAKGNSLISKHADNINALQTGVRQSMQAQAKSERLKTELITTVSHDLRTPLTSIITYTDLLKSDTLTDEERMKYVSIVESKSQRLKTLIE